MTSESLVLTLTMHGHAPFYQLQLVQKELDRISPDGWKLKSFSTQESVAVFVKEKA
jgi:hypothetical protein